MKTQRTKIVVRGAVQGVGFRPFVYRLATDLGLKGWVLNSSQGVFIEAEGDGGAVEQFLLRLRKEAPPRAFIQSLESSILQPAGYENFDIRESDDAGGKSVLIMPDIATCPDCLREIFDPSDRRYLYPFTNCTNCGPRFSIIESLPYDRPNTSMSKFTMCRLCEREYHDPADRRFHAQPTACPLCGPKIEMWDKAGRTLEDGHEAIELAAEGVRVGIIVALKGIGGFQLLVNACDTSAVDRLREHKHREAKPFAVMYPTLEEVRRDCVVSPLEERLLTSPEAPIVLLDRRTDVPNRLAASLAPRNPCLGVILPYSPLHHILMRELGTPVVATSGNLSDDPICIDELDALERLRDIADVFLVHNRPIIRHLDDSVARILLGREQVLRRARGYAPLPVHMKQEMPAILAVGAHLKNTVALTHGSAVFLSQHVGDLETANAYSAFRRAASDLPRLYETKPGAVACDLHPDYLSTKFALNLGLPLIQVQHHYAHVLACMAENETETPALGVVWDGAGLGPNGSIWGGEFLRVDAASYHRSAHFLTFRLPGGSNAIKEPRRSALGALYEVFRDELFNMRSDWPVRDFDKTELPLLRKMLARGLSSPLTSSAGRLFDAVASIAGLCQRSLFEGQAAMELEFAVAHGITETYHFKIEQGDPIVLDWRPTLKAVLEDVRAGEPTALISARFHNTLASMTAAVAELVGEPRVVLTGGCFQNRYLTTRCVHLLEGAGFSVAWHQRVPPNDGGIALGQAVAAARAPSRAPTANILEELVA